MKARVSERGPTTPTLDDVAQHILALLPSDGTPVLNRVMRVMLSRELETPISQELYFEARDRLFDEGRVGRLRGQGGQIFLAPEEPKRKQERPARGAQPELKPR
jgi:hypothetical protein